MDSSYSATSTSVRVTKPSNRLVVGGSSYNPTNISSSGNAHISEEKKVEATSKASAALSDEEMDDDDDEDMLVYDHGYDDDYDAYGEEY